MKRRVRTVLIFLNLAFIWGNSAMSGADSSQVSGGLLELLGRFLPFLAGEEGHFLIRKLAHFSEFACLGFLTGWRAEKRRASILGFGLAAACIDETIQLYVPGRSSSLLDVWLDTAGFAAGFVSFLAGRAIYRHFQLRRK